MQSPGNPYSGSELAKALHEMNEALAGFYGSLAPDVFFSRPPKGWSPAENVKHLSRAAAILGLGVRMPRGILRVLFRKAKKPPRRFDEVQRAYAKRLAGGAGSGMYTPLKESPSSKLSARQKKLVDGLRHAGMRLEDALAGWTEQDLDLCRLPHPILGAIPVREMFMFTILHDLHHTQIVESRLSK